MTKQRNGARKMRTRERLLFNWIGGVIVFLLALVTLVPFWLVVAGSFSTEAAIVRNGYSLRVQDFTMDAYRGIGESLDTLLQAYKVTAFITVVSTFLFLALTSMAGYVLSRPDFAWRNRIAYYFYFPCLFSGGTIPTYLLMVGLGMRNNIMALVIGGLFGAGNAFLVRNYVKMSIPYSITESARIDGAGDFRIYWQLILPLSGPVLAVIGLGAALGKWNEWQTCLFYITDKRLYTLQYYLFNIINKAAALKELAIKAGVDISEYNVPMQTTKLAMTVVATGPIILLYPFLQRFFVKGIVVGAVKG